MVTVRLRAEANSLGLNFEKDIDRLLVPILERSRAAKIIAGSFQVLYNLIAILEKYPFHFII
jgi:hypothetical protein